MSSSSREAIRHLLSLSFFLLFNDVSLPSLCICSQQSKTGTLHSTSKLSRSHVVLVPRALIADLGLIEHIIVTIHHPITEIMSLCNHRARSCPASLLSFSPPCMNRPGNGFCPHGINTASHSVKTGVWRISSRSSKPRHRNVSRHPHRKEAKIRLSSPSRTPAATPLSPASKPQPRPFTLASD